MQETRDVQQTLSHLECGTLGTFALRSRAMPPISLAISPRVCCPFEELPPRVFKFSRLRCRFLFDRYEFVAELLRLPSEFRFEAFLTLGVTRCPKRPVVFDLLLHHRVEDDRELVRSRRGRPRRSQFALHAAQIVPQRGWVAMQGIRVMRNRSPARWCTSRMPFHST